MNDIFTPPQAELDVQADNGLSNATPAGFWIRLGACIIDYILISIVSFVISFVIAFIIGLISESAGAIISTIVSIALSVGFYVYCWSKYGATPGKKLLNLKVINAETGGLPTVGQAVGRWFGYILSGIVLCLGFIWIAFDVDKQGWHDKLAKTKVVFTNE